MIVTKLLGGLGNQMFQYALGRSLAIRNNTLLKLDISGFLTYKLHAYGLGAFNIKEVFATKDDILTSNDDSNGLLNKIVIRTKRLANRQPIKCVTEKKLQFDKDILELGDNVYLKGYWQSEKYFKNTEETIRREFTVKTPQSGKNSEIAESIKREVSVSVHIRRGDYVSNPDTRRIHGICGPEYYAEAIKIIRHSVGNHHLFVFSDDPDWAKRNLSFDCPTTVVDNNGIEKNYEDLRLMSQCCHHIIANSSFSWWGAWLSQFPPKIVIAPRKWFADPELNRNTEDRIPDHWLRV